MHIRKTLALLLALALAMVLPAMADVTPQKPAPLKTAASKSGAHTIEKRTLGVYFGDMDASIDMDFYFMDGVDDMPWVELWDWVDFMVVLNNNYMDDKGYELSCELKGDEVIFERENGFHMTVDFEKNSVAFDDYDGFLHRSADSALIDLLSDTGFNDAGEAALFQRVSGVSFDRYGDELLLDLAAYGIELITQGGNYYVPLQTLSDFLVSPVALSSLLYNTKAVFLADRESLGNLDEGLTPLGEYYYSAEPRDRSAALAKYGYAELCLMLDNLYGLKEVHDIDNFSQLFWQVAFDDLLSGASAEEADLAMDIFIDFYLDDLHSHFSNWSWMTGAAGTEERYGMASQKISENIDIYGAARMRALGSDWPDYQEVGNTAYITFDSFESGFSGNYYAALEGENLPDDTIGLIIYAHNQIYRDDSPIENVVIDLSNNIGGDIDAAIFLMSWCLGEAPFSVKNTCTGALSTSKYRADVNLDRRFNSGDVLDDKKLFCLISPVSFSCGNLVPAAFKSSQRVTLLGRPSGGGSCSVLPMSTAWGTVFEISGNYRMSFLKNGSFYDIDRGVDPDFTIYDINHFYDREALTDYINNLF